MGTWDHQRILFIQRINLGPGKKDLVKKTISKGGKKQVTGISKALKESASYPPGFGYALAALMEPQGSKATFQDRAGLDSKIMSYFRYGKPRSIIPILPNKGW